MLQVTQLWWLLQTSGAHLLRQASQEPPHLWPWQEPRWGPAAVTFTREMPLRPLSRPRPHWDHEMMCCWPSWHESLKRRTPPAWLTAPSGFNGRQGAHLRLVLWRWRLLHHLNVTNFSSISIQRNRSFCRYTLARCSSTACQSALLTSSTLPKICSYLKSTSATVMILISVALFPERCDRALFLIMKL